MTATVMSSRERRRNAVVRLQKLCPNFATTAEMHDALEEFDQASRDLYREQSARSHHREEATS